MKPLDKLWRAARPAPEAPSQDPPPLRPGFADRVIRGRAEALSERSLERRLWFRAGLTGAAASLVLALGVNFQTDHRRQHAAAAIWSELQPTELIWNAK